MYQHVLLSIIKIQNVTLKIKHIRFALRVGWRSLKEYIYCLKYFLI